MPAAPVVLDSHAPLKLLRDVPGADTVAQILKRAGERDQPVHMTEVNHAEVQYIIRRTDGAAAWDAIAAELKATPIEFHPATRPLAGQAAIYKAAHKLSLANPLAAALAREKKAELVTGEQGFRALE